MLASVSYGQDIRARVNLSGKFNVNGVLDLSETSSFNRKEVKIVGRVTGLKPGQHGFHVHQWGDIFTKDCDSTGPHYNPEGVSIKFYCNFF